MLANANVKKQAFAIAMLLLLALSIYTFSQSAETSLSGTVKDETGAVLPGATAMATNMATKAETKVLANSTSIYSFPRLPPGKYTLVVQADGFKTYTIKNVKLTSTDTKSLDVVMQRIKAKDNKVPTFSGNGKWNLDPMESDLYPRKTVTTDNGGSFGGMGGFGIMGVMGGGFGMPGEVDRQNNQDDLILNQPEPFACQEDNDCVSVKSGCCGCNAGGKAMPLNKNYLGVWIDKLNRECRSVGCATVMSNDWSCFAPPKCINQRCTLIKQD